MSELLNIYKTLKNKKWINLSHKIDENSPKFPALPALEKEGEFFIIERVSLVGYLILLMGVFAFSLVVLTEVFTISQGVSLALTILLIPAIVWKLAGTKIRV